MTGGLASYLVVDVEATCDDSSRFPRHEMEIIEIGAVRVGASGFEVQDEYQTFVRPVRHPILTEFCTRLTSIRQRDVERAPRFVAAMEEFRRWIATAPVPAAFCSWGDYDRKQILQDCKFHGIADPMPATHLNLKALFSQARGLQKRLGMAKALREAGLVVRGTHHRGIDDARNIARLLPFCLVSSG